METAQIAEPISGNKLYRQRARQAFPILVRQAVANQSIYYSDLADELDMPNPRNLNYSLGSIGRTLKILSEEWNKEIPPLSCLVINKTTNLPIEGVGWFIDNTNAFSKLPLKQKRAIVKIELQKIFAYPRWLEVLRVQGIAVEMVRVERRVEELGDLHRIEAETEQISLNSRQIKLLDYLRQSGGHISNNEYQILFGVSKRTASNDLSELTTHGLLVVEGAGRTTKYRLANSDA